MRKLFIYELKKIFTNRLLYILLIVFALASRAGVLIPMIMSPQTSISKDYAYENLLKQYGGRLTQNNYSILMFEYHCAEKYYNENDGIDYGEPGKFTSSRIMDYYLLGNIIYDIDYIIDFAATNQNILKQAQSNIELYTKRNDTYMVNENRLILDLYSKKPALKLINTSAWFYLSYNPHVFFILIMLIIFIAPIFSSEHESRMYPLIYSSVRGKKGILFAKLSAATIFSVFISTVFEVFNCLLFIFRDGLSGFAEYIQNSSEYSLCPYNITLGEYIIMHTLLITLGAISFSLIICLISSVCKNSVLSISISAAAVMGLYAIIFTGGYLPTIASPGLFKFTNSTFYRQFLGVNERYLLTGLFEPHQYFTGFHTVKFFNLPVLSIHFNIILSLIKCILLIMAAFAVYCKPFRMLRKIRERKYAG